MTFETEEEKRIQKKAIEVFVNTFGGTYQKLDASDVDYKIFDKNKNLIAYAEISGRVRTIRVKRIPPRRAERGKATSGVSFIGRRWTRRAAGPGGQPRWPQV